MIATDETLTVRTTPIAGYAVHNAPLLDLVLMKLPFYLSPEHMDEPQPGRTYVMNQAQAIELADALQQAVKSLQEFAEGEFEETKH